MAVAPTGNGAMRLTQGLSRSAGLCGGRTATVFAGRIRTWSQVATRVARLAGALQRLGAGPGDRIALLALNSDRYIEAYYAILWAGCVAAPLNIRSTPAEFAAVLADCAPTLAFADQRFVPAAEAHFGDLSRIILLDEPEASLALGYEALLAAAEPLGDLSAGGEALAAIFYTGGTTGAPKGVMLSHASLTVNFLAATAVCPYPPEPVYLHAAPMFHLADAAMVFGMTLLGGTHVVQPSFTPAGVVEAVTEQGADTLLLVPTMIQLLAEHLRTAPADLSGVRRISYGASPISETLLRRALEIFPGAQFCQAYGQTELSPVATLLEPAFHRPDAADRLRSAGRPIPTVELRIVAPDMTPRAAGQVGEVVVRGPGLMQGYWGKPELTAETFVDGWLRTGDAGYLDDDGFLVLVDRVKDMIVTGGENVFSGEVENALAQHPAVLECAVIGAPDETWGERVHAFVRLRPGQTASAEDLQAHCDGLIATFKRPRGFTFTETPLPLSGAGKILKAELRAMFWAGAHRNVS